MTFRYVESQKPTRHEQSWVIGMAEAGFNINYVAYYFDIHKTIPYRIINRFVQTRLAGDRPRSSRQIKKLTPLEERFLQITSGRLTFLTANPLCTTSRNCLWYMSVHQNCLEPSPMHVENVKYSDILSFLKKHCMTGTARHTIAVLQYLVLDKIVITFTAKGIWLSLC